MMPIRYKNQSLEMLFKTQIIKSDFIDYAERSLVGSKRDISQLRIHEEDSSKHGFNILVNKANKET